jgi:3',5'-cyclic AMP phosphodiesterase CpdA
LKRILHVSDLHFGAPSVAVQVEALERIIGGEHFDAIVVSGDLSQRTRTREFERARELIQLAERRAPVLVVPGNHDVAWWMAPMGLGSVNAMYARYRKFIRDDLEPQLRLPGLTLVGLNSAQGIRPGTLTTRPRDLSVVGAVRGEQWANAKRAFDAAPTDDLKVLVLHHNLLRGQRSNRWGLASRALGVTSAAVTGADLVLCGHDHEDRIDHPMAAGRRFVVSCANTLSDRVRGGGPSSLNVIDADEKTIAVTPWAWNVAAQTFTPSQGKCFTR